MCSAIAFTRPGERYSLIIASIGEVRAARCDGTQTRSDGHGPENDRRGGEREGELGFWMRGQRTVPSGHRRAIIAALQFS